MSPMADAEEAAAATMAARSTRAADLWIAALGSISGDLVQPAASSPSRNPQSPLPRDGLFADLTSEILNMFKYARTLSVVGSFWNPMLTSFTTPLTQEK